MYSDMYRVAAQGSRKRVLRFVVRTWLFNLSNKIPGPEPIVIKWGEMGPLSMAENKWVTGVIKLIGVISPFITGTVQKD